MQYTSLGSAVPSPEEAVRIRATLVLSESPYVFVIANPTKGHRAVRAGKSLVARGVLRIGREVVAPIVGAAEGTGRAGGVPEEAQLTTEWRGPMKVAIAGILLVLVIVSVAHAECAWVLWLGTGTTYTPFGAYGGNAGERECKAAATQLMTDMSKDAKQLAEFLKASSRYLCLPDTVEPRGPKGTK